MYHLWGELEQTPSIQRTTRPKPHPADTSIGWTVFCMGIAGNVSACPAKNSVPSVEKRAIVLAARRSPHREPNPITVPVIHRPSRRMNSDHESIGC